MPRDPTPRDEALDAVKGLLVLVMVLYHTMNHFAAVDPWAYGALRFVNGGFVFLAGYVVTACRAPDPSAAGPLALRGLKLVLLFTALNLLLAIAGARGLRGGFALEAFLAHPVEVYLRGEDGHAAFRILLPIGYLLVLGGLLQRTGRWRVPLLAAGVGAASLYPAGVPADPVPYFMLVGAVGLAWGEWQRRRPLPRLRHPLVLAAGIVVVGAAMDLLSGNALAYGLGLGVLTMLLRDAADVWPAAWGRPTVVRLGVYSLVGYIVQIALLNALRPLAGGAPLPLAAWMSVALAVSVALVALTAVLARMRSRVPAVGRLYRLVFG